MVGNCLDAIARAVELHEKAGTLVLDSQQAQDICSVHVPAIVGNWVAHYSTASGTSFSVAVLNSVINSIDRLAECFKYDHYTGTTNERKWYRALDRQ